VYIKQVAALQRQIISKCTRTNNEVIHITYVLILRE